MLLVLCGEAKNTNLIVLDLKRPELELTIKHTRGVHANHYTTYAVVLWIYIYAFRIVQSITLSVPNNDASHAMSVDR